MKRRYKAGDWVRITLGGEYDALAIIARACGSRLFGYFFAIPATHVPSHAELRALGPQNAICALLFGGAPIEQARWRIVAASLAFDPQIWPFPFFVSRGAFGESWMRVTYDPQTLQAVERRSAAQAEVAGLPDARFADAGDIETVLRRRISGAPAALAQTVLEMRTPVDPGALRMLAGGGRIQFSSALRASDLDAVAKFVQANPHVEVRVHGFPDGFDAAALSRISHLRHLVLDVHRLQHADALRELRELRSLSVGGAAMRLDFLDALPNLHVLELRGTRATLEPLARAATLQALVLENTPERDFSSFASAGCLERLVLAHGEYVIESLVRLQSLRHLELRALDARSLPEFSAMMRLERVTLDGLRNVTDLRALASAPALRDLRIAAMPQLNVRDFEPLQGAGGLQRVEIELGSRAKEREVYRLLKRGNTYLL